MDKRPAQKSRIRPTTAYLAPVNKCVRTPRLSIPEMEIYTTACSKSDTDREWFGVGFGARDSEPGESALEQRHQSGEPVAHDEQEQKRNREIVLVLERIVNREREIGADKQFCPGHPAEALAVFVGANNIFLGLDTIFGRSDKSGLLSDQSFEHGDRVGDGEADAECHQNR